MNSSRSQGSSCGFSTEPRGPCRRPCKASAGANTFRSRGLAAVQLAALFRRQAEAAALVDQLDAPLVRPAPRLLLRELVQRVAEEFPRGLFGREAGRHRVQAEPVLEQWCRRRGADELGVTGMDSTSATRYAIRGRETAFVAREGAGDDAHGMAAARGAVAR